MYCKKPEFSYDYFPFQMVLQLQSRRVGRAYDGGTCFKLPWKPEHSRRWVNNMYYVPVAVTILD